MEERVGGWPEVMTVKDLAAYLQIGRSYAYYLVRTGEIPSFAVGRNIRVRRSDVNRWLAANRRELVPMDALINGTEGQ